MRPPVYFEIPPPWMQGRKALSEASGLNADNPSIEGEMALVVLGVIGVGVFALDRFMRTKGA